MKKNCCLALVLLFALAMPAVLLAAEAPAQPVAAAPAGTAGAGCAPAPTTVDGLFSPAANPPASPWDQRLELATCDCSGFDCGYHCSPIQCVLLPNGHCGAICRCRP